MSAGLRVPYKHDHTAVALAPCQHVIDRRPQRREAKPAGDEHDIVAFGSLDRPGGAERSAHAQHRSGLQLRNRPADRADIAHGVHVDRRGPPDRR